MQRHGEGESIMPILLNDLRILEQRDVVGRCLNKEHKLIVLVKMVLFLLKLFLLFFYYVKVGILEPSRSRLLYRVSNLKYLFAKVSGNNHIYTKGFGTTSKNHLIVKKNAPLSYTRIFASFCLKKFQLSRIFFFCGDWVKLIML